MRFPSVVSKGGSVTIHDRRSGKNDFSRCDRHGLACRRFLKPQSALAA
ncbi:hypothetical protein SynMITS9220_02151 [Synechococcus sp. MIT S9220]|nr:hypothetical protein SynMITS9220_02151 [Synechococcus sp. MIT S9220]